MYVCVEAVMSSWHKFDDALKIADFCGSTPWNMPKRIVD